jgi:hypothetical protein
VYSIVVGTSTRSGGSTATTATMTPGQFAGAFSVSGISGGAAENITFSTNSSTIDASNVTHITGITLSAGSGTTAGSNTLTIGSAAVTSIVGADGNDTINVTSGDAAENLLEGTYTGNLGTDTINVTGNTSNAGNDAITLASTITGLDVINFSHTTSSVSLTTADDNLGSTGTLTVNATGMTSSGGTLLFDGALEASGRYVVNSGANKDTIIGGGGADSITSGAGTDVVVGRGGADTISGGDTLDYLYGDGHGTKSAIRFEIKTAETSPNGATVILNILGVDITTTLATADNDVTKQAVKIVAAINASGVATAANSSGVITVTAYGDGNLFNYAAGASNITIRGTATNMVIKDGADANDTNDQAVTSSAVAVEAAATGSAAGALATTPGADSINGGGGDDLISGGGGADTLTGGTGNDVFVFSGEMGNTLANLATITDYRATGGTADTIVLTNITTVTGTVSTVQNFSSAASLGDALNLAAASNDSGTAYGLVVFMYGGDTYIYIEKATGSSADTYVAADDIVIKLTGTPYTTSTAIAGLGIDGV